MLAARMLEARPFALSDVPGMVAWFTPRALIGYSDGNAVEIWPNACGRGPDAVQATAGKRPVYKTNILNGRPVVRFTAASGHRLVCAMGEKSQPTTLFIVFKIPSATGGHQFIVDGTDSVKRQMLYYSSGGKMCVNAGILGDAAQALPWGFLIMCLGFNGANGTFYINGSPIWGGTGVNFGTNAISGLSLGAAYNDTSFLSGDIAEFMLYNEAVSAANRKLIETYLGTEYGIAVAP